MATPALRESLRCPQRPNRTSWSVREKAGMCESRATFVFKEKGMTGCQKSR